MPMPMPVPSSVRGRTPQRAWLSPAGSSSARWRIRKGAPRLKVAEVQASLAVGGLRRNPSSSDWEGKGLAAMALWMAAECAKGRAHCREEFAHDAALAFAWTGLARCATGSLEKTETGPRERRRTGLRAQPKRGCHRKNRAMAARASTGTGKGCTGTGMRVALGALRMSKERPGRAHRARYMLSSMSSKPKRAGAPQNVEQRGWAVVLDTIGACLKPC